MKMIDRKELAEEILLRENIRKAIVIVSGRRTQRLVENKEQEMELRQVIRDLMVESQSAVAAVAKHDNTGINALEDLLRNSNLLSVIETGYKSLTTNIQQRLSFRNHILSAIGLSLAPEQSRKAAGEDVEITEDIEIDIGDNPEEDPDFIDVEKDEKVIVDEPDEKEEFGIPGEDKTGRNRAFTDFHNVEKNILTAFDDLDNPIDTEMFEDFLIKNVALYFDKYENELKPEVDAPAAADDAVAGGPGTASDDSVVAADTEEDPETEAAPIELQEILQHLDIDDIIENLL
jgi:hypothetical protein